MPGSLQQHPRRELGFDAGSAPGGAASSFPAAMPTSGEVADELGSLAVGGAILTFALFPFAIPMIALTIIALVPLLVVGLAAGLVVAAFAAPIVVVRRSAWLRPLRSASRCG